MKKERKQWVPVLGRSAASFGVWLMEDILAFISTERKTVIMP